MYLAKLEKAEDTEEHLRKEVKRLEEVTRQMNEEASIDRNTSG